MVKKAYCDFERYKEFKRDLHEAAFEMIEIPHVRQSGKNSADIRMVVDALDLCYTKKHLDTFVDPQRRFGFFAAREQTARERQDGRRRRGEELEFGPVYQQLRPIPLLRRPRAEERERAAGCVHAPDGFKSRRSAPVKSNAGPTREQALDALVATLARVAKRSAARIASGAP